MHTHLLRNSANPFHTPVLSRFRFVCLIAGGDYNLDCPSPVALRI